jgi:large subunit ribosomal protein L29
MKTVELRKKDKKELAKTVQELTKKLSDLRFKFASGKLKNVKEISNSKKSIARILTIIKEPQPLEKDAIKNA